ncbi:hypothetical protein HZH66_009919 [Vespula vulgaris]|uniref:Dystrophin n=1 Tax=Vespula vulgaris TaxID=7454 RepID=A0A834JKG5_VESVU|nr:hypothetical protein HZH66_009919 [Vespula vulgaris]
MKRILTEKGIPGQVGRTPSRANGKFLLFARRISVICVKLDKGEDVIQRTLSRRKYSKTKEFSFAMSEKRARSSRRSIVKSELHLFEQDLQSEIETHRDVYASLNGTGRKLLSSLASQDDAVMLQRRLDEMNQRWHHLKAKSMAIRDWSAIRPQIPVRNSDPDNSADDPPWHESQRGI